MISDTTYEVQFVPSDGTFGRKSIVHRHRLKGVHSQAQKDILAETRQWQEAVLASLPGVSDEPEAGASEGSSCTAAADCRRVLKAKPQLAVSCSQTSIKSEEGV